MEPHSKWVAVDSKFAHKSRSHKLSTFAFSWPRYFEQVSS